MEQAFGIIQSGIGQLEVVYKKVRSKRNVYGKKQMNGRVCNDLPVFCIDTFFSHKLCPDVIECEESKGKGAKCGREKKWKRM